MNWSLGLMLVTVLGAISAYFLNKESSDQLNRIEKLDSLSNELTNEIGKIQNLHLNITKQIDAVVRENGIMAAQNIELSKVANDLITEVNALTKASKQIIDKVDVRAEKEYSQLAMTGKISLDVDDKIKQGKGSIQIIMGGFAFDIEVESLVRGMVPVPMALGTAVPVQLQLENGKLLLSVTAYDISGNWLVEISNNYWRRNPLAIGKFNYDSHGVEFIDNKNQVVCSIDIRNGNRIVLQGFYPYPETGMGLIMSNGLLTQVSLKSNTPQQLRAEIGKAKIKQLFEYSGENWLGRRK